MLGWLPRPLAEPLLYMSRLDSVVVRLTQCTSCTHTCYWLSNAVIPFPSTSYASDTSRNRFSANAADVLLPPVFLQVTTVSGGESVTYYMHACKTLVLSSHVPVRVALQCQFPECLLDFLLRCLARDAKHLIQVHSSCNTDAENVSLLPSSTP